MVFEGDSLKDYKLDFKDDKLVKVELPSVEERKVGKWIPCSEKLPKKGEYNGNVAKYYLVQNEYGDMLVARYTHSEYWGKYIK